MLKLELQIKFICLVIQCRLHGFAIILLQVYVEVLKLLLSPPDSIPGVSVPMHSAVDKNERPVDVETALTLLEAHPSRVHVLEALTHIPDNVPLSRLRHFLAAGLRDIVRRRRNCQLLRGLLFAQRLQVIILS